MSEVVITDPDGSRVVIVCDDEETATWLLHIINNGSDSDARLSEDEA